jgi:AcrR family transcriptional regulator
LASNEKKATAGRKGKVTRGGQIATGVSADRRARVANGGASAKGVRTRAAIIAAARKVFEEKGYIDARVSDIVAEADIAHGSYYTYFSSKQAVFRAVVEEVGEEITAAVAPSADDVRGDTWGNLKRANSRYLEVYRRNSKIMVLNDQVATIDPEMHEFRLAGRRRHVSRVMAAIVRLQERGLADPDIDPHTTAGALVAMLSAFAYWSTASVDEYAPDEVERTVTEIWTRALGVQSSVAAAEA